MIKRLSVEACLTQSEGPAVGELAGLSEESSWENDIQSQTTNQAEIDPAELAEDAIWIEPEANGICRSEGQTDTANSKRFVDRFNGRILYVPDWQDWLAWDGKRWVRDKSVSVLRFGKEYAESLWLDHTRAAQSGMSRDELAKLRTFVKKSNDRGGIISFIALATADKRVVCSPEEMNRDPVLLNCQNGTLNLETGELAKHNPADRITQLAGVAYDEKASCPQWLATLDLVFDHDRGLIAYFKQLCGYMVSGLTEAHIMPIAYGTGRNGKSTITKVLAGLLGDYATSANEELLLPTKQSQHPTERAQLYQKRFVAIDETTQERGLAEAKVKNLTGGDRVNCRGVSENFWTFDPTHKFWLSTNYRPKISGTDEGIWRRIRLIPFTVNISRKTQERGDMWKWLIENEGPGILAWAAQGFREWRKSGFTEPESVTRATADYRAEEDALGRWIAETCIEEQGAEERADRLYRAYSASGGRISQKAFGEQLGQRFEKLKATSGPNRLKVVYRGLRLATSAEDTSLVPDVPGHPSAT
jgi:putative DNA primase/helicase